LKPKRTSRAWKRLCLKKKQTFFNFFFSLSRALLVRCAKRKNKPYSAPFLKRFVSGLVQFLSAEFVPTIEIGVFNASIQRVKKHLIAKRIVAC